VPTDLTVVLKDKPGQLATLGGATGEVGVNIEGMCAFTGEGRGIIHLLVADDTVGSGHKWRLIDEAPWRRCYIVLKPGAPDLFVANG